MYTYIYIYIYRYITIFDEYIHELLYERTFFYFVIILPTIKHIAVVDLCVYPPLYPPDR